MSCTIHTKSRSLKISLFLIVYGNFFGMHVSEDTLRILQSFKSSLWGENLQKTLGWSEVRELPETLDNLQSMENNGRECLAEDNHTCVHISHIHFPQGFKWVSCYGTLPFLPTSFPIRNSTADVCKAKSISWRSSLLPSGACTE